MLCVLQVGNDPNLLKTRAAVLESIGLRVISSRGLEEALERIGSEACDAAILCHTLEASERAMAAAAIRQTHPSVPILLIAEGPEVPALPPVGMDGVLSSRPQRLIGTLKAFLKISEDAGAPLPAPISIDRGRSRPH